MARRFTPARRCNRATTQAPASSESASSRMSIALANSSTPGHTTAQRSGPGSARQRESGSTSSASSTVSSP